MTSKHTNPVFVVGFFRSGTSLLYALLNGHPQVSLMYECGLWDFPEWLSRLRFRGNWLERLEFFSHALSRHRLVFGAGLQGLESVRRPEDLYMCYGLGKRAARWGEKSPEYCERLEQLARRYPSASFIVLWRDPVETYESIIAARRKAPFFRRRSSLNRLIYSTDQMVRQTAALRRMGARVHELTYDDLVARTENACRGLCQFLEIEFHPGMMDLAQADFSAIQRAPHHDHLRRGVIERRSHRGENLRKGVLAKLERFRTRWERLRSSSPGKASSGEPGSIERGYHHILGAGLGVLHDLKRAALELLPLAWLRAYRRLKAWFLDAKAIQPARRRPLREQVTEHWVTVLASALFLAGVAVIDFHSDPDVTFAPFYSVPPALLAVVVSRRWGLVAAALTAVAWSSLDGLSGQPGFRSVGLLLWNSSMRFFLIGALVLLLDRRRGEIEAPDPI